MTTLIIIIPLQELVCSHKLENDNYVYSYNIYIYTRMYMYECACTYLCVHLRTYAPAYVCVHRELEVEPTCEGHVGLQLGAAISL